MTEVQLMSTSIFDACKIGTNGVYDTSINNSKLIFIYGCFNFYIAAAFLLFLGSCTATCSVSIPADIWLLS